MLCRVLITAIAVTYLMCVLVLSGMQKEDLDVSMLTKLQRHNVNIDDMNNEELRETCSQPQDNNNNTNDANKTNQLINKTKNANLERYFKTNAGFEVSKKRRHAEHSTVANKIKHYNIVPKKTVYEKKLNVDEAIQYNDKQPLLDSFLKLLEDTKLNEAIKEHLFKSDSIKEHKSKSIITTESIHSFETNDTLNRLFKNFVAKRSNLSVKSINTPNSANSDDTFQQLYSYRMLDTKNNTNFNSGLDHEQTASYVPFQQNTLKIPTEVIPEQLEKKSEKSIIPNQPNINEGLTLMNTVNRFKPYITNTEFFQNQNKNAEENFKMSRNLDQNSYERVGTTIARNIKSKHEIPRDIIKEIADNVKEIVLRDLREELHKITTVTTTTTQSTTKRELTVETKSQDAIMKNFLALFEEIKSLKQNTIVIKSDSEKAIDNKHEFLLPFQMQRFELKDFKINSQPTNNIQSKLHFNTNQVKRINPTVNSQNIYNFAPQLHRYKSNGPVTKLPTITERVVKKPEPVNDLLPLTVQTNNIEILPLGIPIDKPQNVIRQNIIITTKAPYRIIPIINRNQARDTLYLNASKTKETYKTMNMPLSLSKNPYRPPIHTSNFHLNKNDDVIRFTLGSNGHSKYSSDYYEKINIGKYKTFSDEIIQDTPRYHERLEKMEPYLDYPEENKYAEINDCCNEKFGYSKEMVECCNRRIVSRQQMSLNNIKKKSYDDTHFKKLLHSQQKVTDMLEKILGGRGNVQSVETA